MDLFGSRNATNYIQEEIQSLNEAHGNVDIEILAVNSAYYVSTTEILCLRYLFCLDSKQALFFNSVQHDYSVKTVQLLTSTYLNTHMIIGPNTVEHHQIGD